MRRTTLTLFCMTLFASLLQAESPFEPASTGGIALLDRLLTRLATHRRVLVIGAHPDDEDTTLLSLVARGMGGESAYFSLTRGEGGQNLIGPELFEDLGLIRSQELLAARGVDGARQFFSRAYDFGFTRSLDETLGFWPREALLEDAVRVVRRFRPQVIVSVFPPTPAAGHGQHQTAGVIAGEVIAAAADPARFPDTGPAWQATSLYRSAFFRRGAAEVTLPIGGIDPVSGRSYFQLAMASRSMHRSQDMGTLQPMGPRDTGVDRVEGPPGDDLFAGVDTRLRGIAGLLGSAPGSAAVRRSLDRAAGLAAEARSSLVPSSPSAAVPFLLEYLAELDAASALVERLTPASGAVAAEALIDEKRQLAESAAIVASGTVIDAMSSAPLLVAGGSAEISLGVYAGGSMAVSVAPRLRGPAVAADTPLDERSVAAGTLERWTATVDIPAGADPTVPYFLRRPRQGEVYDWTGVDEATRNEPFEPPPLVAELDVTLNGRHLRVAREVVYVTRDQVVGEIRTPLRVVPPVEVSVSPSLIVWPAAEGGPKAIQVELTKNAEEALDGRIELDVPAGWERPEPVEVALAAGVGRRSDTVELRRPADAEAGEVWVAARFVGRGDAGEPVAGDRSYPVISYPHIRPVVSPRSAKVGIRTLDLQLPRVERVAYVRGASDRVPESLLSVGVPLTLLTAADLVALSPADLQRFDAVVIGSRAYETDPDLGAANRVLLDYVEAGGLMIVQYQQYQFSMGGFAPRPLEIARPHDRITDQTAAVEILDPAHRAFRVPHRISDEDWQGWVQERGLYFPGTWDPAYTPLLRMADPDMPPQEGALLVASLGRGTYVYTGLAFFRQLPAGVPGAFRLFLNLLALGGGG